MKALLFISFILVGIASSFSQNVGIGTNSPDASAKLEVSSTNSGVLIPNISIGSVASAAPVTSPATGLLVWNTNSAITGGYGIGYYYWNGTVWTKLATEPVSSNTVGDVKHGFQAADHSGWVQLDGRLISSLSVTQQAAATSLGFGTNLPDASDKVLKQKGALNSTGGTNTVTIGQTNIPNYNLNGTAASNGGHAHTASTGNDSHSHSYSGYTQTDFHNHSYQDYGGTGVLVGDDGSMNGSVSYVRDGIRNTTTTGDSHSHYYSGTTNSDFHNHTVTVNADGDHTHTVSVSSGGSDTPLDVENAYLSTNVFIYLGL